MMKRVRMKNKEQALEGIKEIIEAMKNIKPENKKNLYQLEACCHLILAYTRQILSLEEENKKGDNND